MQHPICDVMESLPLSILPDDGAAWAWHRMRKEGVSVLPVVDFGELVGLVYARDLEHRGSRELARLQVRAVMRGEPAVAAPWAPIPAVLQQLLRVRQEAAVIVDRGHLVGLFTLDGAARRCGSALDAFAMRH